MSGSSEESGGDAERTTDVIQFTESEKEVLAYLRSSKRVDLRRLGEEQKQKIRAVLDGLHNEKKISLLRISKEVGRSYTAIWGLCRALEIHTGSVGEADKASAESRSKHRKLPFDETEEDRAYLVGFKDGDLTAWQVSGTAVMVSSTTTHPAFADVFQVIFRRYSHVYQYPMFEEDKGYKWKLGVRLDNSFQFLLKTAMEAVQEFSTKRSTLLGWLAGMIDSDGSIYSSASRGYPRVRVSIYNSNVPLLELIIKESQKIGYKFDGPYLLKDKGTVTPFGIRYTKDLWYIGVQQTAAAQQLLGELPLRHWEKPERKKLALQVGHRSWDEIEAELIKLKTRLNYRQLKLAGSSELV